MAEKPLKVLVVTGGGYHPFGTCGPILKETYEYGGLAKCTLVERDNAFRQSLSGYDVIAIYTQGGKLGNEEENNLLSFVKNGGGLVGFHCASDSFVENAGYLSLLGSKFVTHGPGTPNFPVEVSNKSHTLAGRLPKFNITDEFYILELKDNPLDIFLTSPWQGKPQPMAYTRTFGKGRVFYTAMGHDERAFRNTSFKIMAVRGLLYAAGRWQKEGKPVGVGLLGYGGAFGMGKHHGDTMHSIGGFKVLAACDLDSDRLKLAETEFPGIKTYNHLDRMLRNDRVEVVVVILPHNVHFESTLKIFESGRGAVVEKPFCIKPEEADKLINTADRKKVLLTVYQSRRWDHHFLTAKKLVEAGMIGEVFETQIDFGNYSHPGTWWRSDKNLSGGILYDWGVHCLDWMLQLIRDKVVSVSGYSQKRVWYMITNEDHFRVIIRFRNGAVANFSNSSICAAASPGWRILGSQGAIHFPTVFDQEADLTTILDGKPVITKVPVEPADWPAFYRNLADHLHHGVPLACQPEDSARLIGIIAKAEESAKAKKELPFNDKYYQAHF